jgi:hypothetical protein
MSTQLQRLLRPALAVVILIAGFLATQQPRSSSAQLDSRYFADTGFRVDNDQFWEIFDTLGQQRGLGYPISRTFRLLGRPTQVFQRGMLQIAPESHAYIVSMFQDEMLFPYESINGSVFPKYDITLVEQAPLAGSENYDLNMIAFLKQWVPDEYRGQSVNFLDTYQNAVRDESGDMRILANLPVWGIATSHPQLDLNNPRIVYQRFERGMMVYEAGCRCTRILPVGDLFKSVLTGESLPADFESQRPDSPFLRQYDTDSHVGPFRKEQLPDTDLTYAFLQSNKEPVSWAMVKEIAPPPAPEGPLPDPFTYALAPTSTPSSKPTATATPQNQNRATAVPKPTQSTGQ